MNSNFVVGDIVIFDGDEIKLYKVVEIINNADSNASVLGVDGIYPQGLYSFTGNARAFTKLSDYNITLVPKPIVKHKWTEEEINKAKVRIAEMMIEISFLDIFDDLVFQTYNKSQNNVYFCEDDYCNREKNRFILAKREDDYEYKIIHTAIPSQYDEFNEYIGLLVCLCYYLNKPIPSFILHTKIN